MDAPRRQSDPPSENTADPVGQKKEERETNEFFVRLKSKEKVKKNVRSTAAIRKRKTEDSGLAPLLMQTSERH